MPPTSASSSKRRAPTPRRSRVSAYETIKQAILDGELVGGQQLVEASLAEWCTVSRTPIREALTRLEKDGLVDRSDRGLIVAVRSSEEILDIYEIRVELEAKACRLATQRRTEYDLRILRRGLQHGADVDEDDHPSIAKWNEQFHRAVWRCSHNDSLFDLMEFLSLRLARYPGSITKPGRWKIAVEEHRLLADAIEQRDEQRANDLALEHIQTACAIRLELLEDEELI